MCRISISNLALLLFIIASGCGAKLGSSILSKQSPLATDEFILVLRQSDDFINDGVKVGSIKSVDNGFSVNCTYYEVIENLKNIARQNGANIIKITKRISPDRHSSCERIYADIYKVPDFKKHEIEINWDKNRKLTWEDFKGDPFTASSKVSVAALTACDISMESNVSNIFKKPNFFTSNKFSCYSSWVKPTQKNEWLLAHEQCHFAIAEIYRRKFQKDLDEKKLDYANMETEVRTIWHKISKEYNNEQAVYDEQTKHGLDSIQQRAWFSSVQKRLGN